MVKNNNNFLGENKMKSRKGFTLVELMVVILIVSILAAVAIPLMRGRIDSAKWSEGKSTAGTIATALRAYAAEKATAGDWPSPTAAELGFTPSDLTGTYFAPSNYSWTCTYSDTADPPLTFTITVTKPATIATGSTLTLNQNGVFAGGPL
jgi:prepilin-type N-terminal cleavage/methylation domain-containing protein